MFDIATLGVAVSGTLHLKDAAGELLYDGGDRSKPIRVRLHSPGSDAYSTVESRQTSRALKRMNDNEGKLTAATPDERRNETAEDLATVTLDFENFTYGDGSLKGEALFRTAYSDQKLGFIVKQVNKFLADWANFKAASPVN